jgi:hypothetical protein
MTANTAGNLGSFFSVGVLIAKTLHCPHRNLMEAGYASRRMAAVSSGTRSFKLRLPSLSL